MNNTEFDDDFWKMILISAPSGSGKTTLAKYLVEQIPDLKFCVSDTTREPRTDEKHGKDYYFTYPDIFQEKIKKDEFVEWEEVYPGLYYGTSKMEIFGIRYVNKIPILDIDVKGAVSIKKMYQQGCFSIFIEPPSIEELEKRLRERSTDSPEKIEERLNKASSELEFYQNNKELFDITITNEDLSKAKQEILEKVNEYLNDNLQNRRSRM